MVNERPVNVHTNLLKFLNDGAHAWKRAIVMCDHEHFPCAENVTIQRTGTTTGGSVVNQCSPLAVVG